MPAGIEAVLASVAPRARVIRAEDLAHRRGAVTRVTVDPAIPGVGRDVIVKRRDPATEVGAFAAASLRTEQEALELLAGARVDVAPRVLAGGHRAGVLVLTDVGRSVESVIFGDDRAAATAALVALATTTARLHRVARDDDAFGGREMWTIATRDDGWRALAAGIESAGLAGVGRAANVEHDELVAELRSPAAATALVHGDLGPNNAALGEDGHCRLVDFEGAGYQHIGLDAAMLRFPFAWYGRWCLLPPDVQEGMERAYRDTLGWPADRVDDAIAVGCMAMALLRLERLPRIAASGQSPQMAFRRRTQIVSTIDVAVAAARHADRFPALSDWLAEVAIGMRRRWPEARRRAAVYPAFAAGAGDRRRPR